MIDLNDKAYLARLKQAVASNDGRVLIQYLEAKISEADYSKIDLTKNFDEIGRNFALCYNIKEELGKIISFLKSR